MLFDSGKYYKGLHPKSITPLIVGQNINLFHVDSSNGISLETLRKAPNKLSMEHLKSRNFVLYPDSPGLKWAQKK